MRKEKIILSFVASLIGLVVVLVIFFIYQSFKQVKPSEIKEITINNPSPTRESSIFLTIDEPIDEDVVDKRTIKISGKTVPGAKIVILTSTSEEAATPTSDGSFSTSITINSGENIIQISAISEIGETVSVKRIVTFTTESF